MYFRCAPLDNCNRLQSLLVLVLMLTLITLHHVTAHALFRLWGRGLLRGRFLRGFAQFNELV